MNTVPFPNQELIALQASSWVAKIDKGLSERSQQQLDEWLHESPAHGEALIKYASMWDMLDLLEPIAKILPIDSFEEELLAETEVHKVQPRSFGMKAFAGRSGYAIAATFVVCFLTVTFLFSVVQLQSQSNKTNLSASAMNDSAAVAQNVTQQFKTSVGENKSFILTDGSELTLNTDTEVSVEFTEQFRKVVLLKGEVYFDIAKNPSRPFIAITSDSHVTAVGTAFNIELDTYVGTEVLVTEGRVKVDNFSKENLSNSLESLEVYLSKGQKALIQQQQAKVSHYDEFESALAWREGMVVFSGETLEQVVREIDRYTPLSFKVIDDEIMDIQVGGFFQTGDMEQLLLILEQNFGISSQQQGMQILLSKAN